MCGMLEDAIHYFFHCRKFIIERQVFNYTVRAFQPLSIDMILCGSYNLNIKKQYSIVQSCPQLYMLLSVLKPVDSLFEVFLET